MHNATEQEHSTSTETHTHARTCQEKDNDKNIDIAMSNLIFAQEVSCRICISRSL
jgi:hypothetical protein